MKKKHLYAPIFVLSFVVVLGKPLPAQTISIPANTSVGTWDPVTRTYTLTQDVYESIHIAEDNLTLDGAGHRVIGPGYDQSTGYGVYLRGRIGVSVKNVNVEGFVMGILVQLSRGCTLANNTASNNFRGIWLLGAEYAPGMSGSNTLSGNVMSTNQYNFGVHGFSDSDFDNAIDTSNTVDGKPIYYVKNAAGGIYDSSTNAGVFYAINCDNITIKDLTVTGNTHGVLFWKTHNSRIENVVANSNESGLLIQYSHSNTLAENTANSNYNGIELEYSNGNVLANNTTNANKFWEEGLGDWVPGFGIKLAFSSNNTLIGNTASSNVIGIFSSGSGLIANNTANSNWDTGIDIRTESIVRGNTASSNYEHNIRVDGDNNLIYNNNFISPIKWQALTAGTGNIFSLDKPTGGNYWSDWTTPDADGDGFVDYPYVLAGGQDNLPWAVRDGWANKAPVADAGDNMLITSVQQAFTVVQGRATDPDGDGLQYRWLEGQDQLLAWTSVGVNGEAYLNLGTLPYLAIGNHTLTLEVRELQTGGLSASDSMVLTIENSPPVPQPAPSSQVVRMGIDPITIVADVVDFDGDILSYEWLKDTQVLALGQVETVQGGAAVPLPDLQIGAGDPRFPLGINLVELRVTDGIYAPVSAFVSVEFIDTSAPSLSPLPSVTILWPPNHELQPVTIAANAFDNSGGLIHLEVTVESSQPPDADGDGHTIPDYYIDWVDDQTGIIELRLRSERAGNGDGRTYTITITATDASGNRSEALVDIRAAHDQRKM